METPNTSQPPALDQRTRGPWKQILIIFVSAGILGASSCAVMSAAWGNGNHDNLFIIATVIFFAALAAIPVTIVWAIVALILTFVRKRGTQT